MVTSAGAPTPHPPLQLLSCIISISVAAEERSALSNAYNNLGIALKNATRCGHRGEATLDLGRQHRRLMFRWMVVDRMVSCIEPLEFEL